MKARGLEFLRKIDGESPKDKTLHLVADSYATHKHRPCRHGWPSIPDATQEHLHAFLCKVASRCPPKDFNVR